MESSGREGEYTSNDPLEHTDHSDETAGEYTSNDPLEHTDHSDETAGKYTDSEIQEE